MKQKTKRCSICIHPRREEIDQALVSGATERTIVDQFDVSKSAVHRHKTAHLPISLTRALERRVEKEEDDLLEYSIASRDERLRAQTERWSKIHEKALELLDDGDIKGASGLLKESRELEKMVAQDTQGAMEAYNRAMELAPDVTEIKYWAALTMFAEGLETEALKIFTEVFAKEPLWVDVTRRLPAAGLLINDAGELDRILSVAPE